MSILRRYLLLPSSYSFPSTILTSIPRWYPHLLDPRALSHTKSNAERTIIKNVPRHYFYYIDVHGQLFLEETVPKNLTSCFKEIKFLNFFFTRIRLNHQEEEVGGLSDKYRYLSQCGKEFNFIRAEDAPLVFHDLKEDGTSLVWGGDLRFPFDPTKIHVSIKTGRLYHPAPFELYRSNSVEVPDYIQRNLALLKSSLVLSTFMDNLDMDKGTLFFKEHTYPLTFF